ncbi:hypothetical protein, partial [uncultured Methanoculleus sp.]|uniref:hypothetical protein n=1 Tax=uncultured Methanoculleus sp. TaxID=183762 RepID=UPI003204F63B
MNVRAAPTGSPTSGSSGSTRVTTGGLGGRLPIHPTSRNPSRIRYCGSTQPLQKRMFPSFL